MDLILNINMIRYRTEKLRLYKKNQYTNNVKKVSSLRLGATVGLFPLFVHGVIVKRDGHCKNVQVFFENSHKIRCVNAYKILIKNGCLLSMHDIVYPLLWWHCTSAETQINIMRCISKNSLKLVHARIKCGK